MKNGILTIFLFAASAFALNCDGPIIDNANVLPGNQTPIIHALGELAAKGADGRVVTDDPNITPEQYVDSMRRACPSWQSANGGVKNNIVVFLVFPRHRKLGVFTGSEYNHVLHTDILRTQYMAPGFKDGDYARGMFEGISQAAIQIEAYHTSVLHPATTVVTQQAADFSGLWKWLDWILALLAVGCVLLLYIYFRNRRIAAKDAQQRAVQARNQAASRVNLDPSSYAAEQFATLSSSETYNPDTNGLTEAQYDAIADVYNQVGKTVQPRRGRPSAQRPAEKRYPPDQPRQQEAAPSSVPAQSRTIQNNTTIINDGGYYSPPIVPVIVEEPIYRDSYRAPDPEPSYNPPSSSWSDSSSSSSYDSGSSWSDSSSSSDFSSSSDSGSSFGGDSGSF